MVYLGLPYGSNFGWGVLGKEIALAMAKTTEVRLFAPPHVDQRLDDEFELYHLRRLLAEPKDHGRPVNGAWRLNGPVLQAAIGRTLEPFVPSLAPPAEAAYAVFEEDRLAPQAVAVARRHYHRIAAASGYCAEVLRRHGLTEVSVIPHGVDTTLFQPRTEPRPFCPSGLSFSPAANLNCARDKISSSARTRSFRIAIRT